MLFLLFLIIFFKVVVGKPYQVDLPEIRKQMLSFFKLTKKSSKSFYLTCLNGCAALEESVPNLA